jgi:hypothetical protein
MKEGQEVIGCAVSVRKVSFKERRPPHPEGLAGKHCA